MGRTTTNHSIVSDLYSAGYPGIYSCPPSSHRLPGELDDDPEYAVLYSMMMTRQRRRTIKYNVLFIQVKRSLRRAHKKQNQWHEDDKSPGHVVRVCLVRDFKNNFLVDNDATNLWECTLVCPRREYCCVWKSHES